MTPETALQTLGYVEASGQALHAAQLLAEKVAADQQKAAQLVPGRVDLLVRSGLIKETEKSSAASQLSTHAGALETVSNLVAILGEQKQAHAEQLAVAGNGHSVKAAANGANAGRSNRADAGVDLADGGNIGRRRGAGEKSAADLSMIRSLGLEGRIGKRQ